MYTSFFHLNLLDFMNIHKKRSCFSTHKSEKKNALLFSSCIFQPPVLQPAAAEILRFVRHVPRHKPPRVHQHPVDSMPNPSHLSAHHYLEFFLLVSLGRCSFFMKSFKGDYLSVPLSRKFNRCWVGGFPGKAMQWAEIGKPEGFKNKHGLEI